MAKLRVDLCCDMGESFGHYKIGSDETIMKYISTANVACGFHAGDPVAMKRTVDLAKENDVAIGAHPGYPDLIGFGRRKMDLTFEEAKCYTIYQVGALKAFVESKGLTLQHVWLHGALNSAAGKDETIATAVIEGIIEVDEKLIFLHRPGLASYETAKKMGLAVAVAVGVDTEYTDKGIAIPQRDKALTNPEEAASKAVKMIKEKKIKTVSGNYIPMNVHSILVHCDTPNAVEVLTEIHASFEKEGIEVTSLRNVIRHTP
jgi:UPF0271 protein